MHYFEADDRESMHAKCCLFGIATINGDKILSEHQSAQVRERVDAAAMGIAKAGVNTFQFTHVNSSGRPVIHEVRLTHAHTHTHTHVIITHTHVMMTHTHKHAPCNDDDTHLHTFLCTHTHAGNGTSDGLWPESTPQPHV